MTYWSKDDPKIRRNQSIHYEKNITLQNLYSTICKLVAKQHCQNDTQHNNMHITTQKTATWVERHTTLQHLSHIYWVLIGNLTTISAMHKIILNANSIQSSHTINIYNMGGILLCVCYHFYGYLRFISLYLQGPTLTIKRHMKI